MHMDPGSNELRQKNKKGCFSYLNVHFIGIGGIGMSALAKLFIESGARVSGSDLTYNQAIKELIDQGLEFHKGHSEKHARDKDLIIYSSAICLDNVEFQEALKSDTLVIPRGKALAELMRSKRNLVITGSHGKTTTTALCISLFIKSKKNPSYMLGGQFKDAGFKKLNSSGESLNSFPRNFIRNLSQKKKNGLKFKSTLNSLNFFEKDEKKDFSLNFKSSISSQLSSSDWFIAEADESDETLKDFLPEILIITNIDNEHLEHHESISNLKKSLLRLALRLPSSGSLIVCGDNAHLWSLFNPVRASNVVNDLDLVKKSGKHLNVNVHWHSVLEELNLKQKTLFYGFDERNDYVLKKLKVNQKNGENGKEVRAQKLINEKDKLQKYLYSVFYKKRKVFSFTASLHGDENALNALASILAGLHSGVDVETCIENVENFKGVQRRIDHIGKFREIDFFDDYGHHPTEIKALLKTFRETFPQKRLVVLFQPHRFSRTRICWEDFLGCFQNAHKTFILDIFGAGEKPISGIHSKALCEEHKEADYLPENEVLDLRDKLRAGDILLTLGAGDVRKWGEKIFQSLRNS